MIPDREIPFKVSESILRTWNQTTLRGKLLRPRRERLFKMMVTIRIQFDVVVNKQNIVERNYDDFVLFHSRRTKSKNHSV